MNTVAKSVVTAAKTGDMTKLTKKAYDFVYILSGFIAHYNYYGFIDYYQDGGFKQDLLSSMDLQNWQRYLTDGFFTSEEKTIGRGKNEQTYKEYYGTKAAILQEIAEAL
jgi:hypothetical protein